MAHPTDAELDKAATFFRKIIEAADNSNHAGEIALMKAWDAYHGIDDLQAKLAYAYRAIDGGYRFGAFDFSILKHEARDFVAKTDGT